MTTFDELWGRHTPNSWARVPRGPLAAAVGAAIFGATATAFTVGATAVTWGTIGGFLITTAVSSWAMGALMPKQEQPTANRLGNVKEAVGDFDIVYGEVRKGGKITFMETSDRVSNGETYEDDYLHFIVVLAGHQVEAIGDVYFNDEKVTIDANGFVGGRWKNLARVKKYLGSPTQLADPDLVAETTVGSNFRGRGLAYLYVRFDWDKDVFADGMPTVTATVKGRRVFDPRTSTTAWTDNAALCIRDYLSESFGLNSKQSPTSLASPDWNVGANVCDVLVTKKNSTTEKRYTLNTVLSTGQTPRSNIQKMLTSCGGTLFWGQGQWQFKPGYFPAAPYVSFTADDLRSGISLNTKNSRKENFNAVTGVFVDKNQAYAETEYPKVTSAVFLARDNGEDNILDMPLPCTTSPSAAQRLAKMALFRSREEMIISADFSLKAADVKVGDVVQFTFSRYGFSNKFFEVISWKPNFDNGELKISLVLKETSAAAYDWNAEEKDILQNNTNLPDPTSGLAVTNLQITNVNTLQSDGSLLSEAVLSWDRAKSAFIDKYMVQWKRTSDLNWSSTETDEISITLPSIQNGVAYTYRVRAVNFAGFQGGWTQIGATLDGKATAPGLPTGVTATGIMKAIEVKWTNPTDSDFNHVEIWSNATNTTTGATLVAKSSGTNYIDNLAPMTTRWYFLKAVNHSKMKSAYTAGKSATALFVGNGDLQDIDVKQLLQDKGLASVEILTSAPTTGNFEGRTYYNTTDRKLYIYKNGAWQAAVDTSGLADKILGPDNFPQDIRPVEIVSALPTTGNFKGRTVFLLSDNKLYRHIGSPTGSAGFTSAVPTVDLVGTVSGVQIADLAIDTSKLANLAVDTGKIANSAITNLKLGALAVDATKLADSAITEVKIKDDAISAPKIKANAIVADKIAANAIVASKLAIMDMTNLIPDSEFQDPSSWTLSNGGEFTTLASETWGTGVAGSVYSEVFGGAAGYINIASSGRFPVEANIEYYVDFSMRRYNAGTGKGRAAVFFYDQSGAYVTGSSIGFTPVVTTLTTPTTVVDKFVAPAAAAFALMTVQQDQSGTSGIIVRKISVRRKAGGNLIVDGAITTDKIAANAVTATQIKALTITADQIAANTITAAEIKGSTITADKIATNTITATQIKGNTITADEIAANTITADQIAANTITAGVIKSGAITTDKIAAGAIIASKLAVTDWTNLIPNNTLESDDGWYFNADTGFTTTSVPANSTAKGNLYINAGNTTNAYVLAGAAPNNLIPVEENTEYLISAYFRGSGTDVYAEPVFGVWWYDGKGVLLSSAPYAQAVNTTTGYVLRERTIKSVAGARFARFGFGRAPVSALRGTMYIERPSVRRKNGGELIVDGSIKSTHIDADSVRAGILTAGAINASTMFVDNVITSAKLNVDSLSVAGLAVFGNRLQSSNYDATTGDGWVLNSQNGILRVPKASIGSLEIGGNAVTIPVMAQADTVIDLTTNGAWTNILTVSVNREAAPTALLTSVQIDGFGGAGVGFRLVRNGTVIDGPWYNITGNLGAQSSTAINFLDNNLGTGATTYVLQASRANSGDYTSQPRVLKRTLIALHVKR